MDPASQRGSFELSTQSFAAAGRSAPMAAEAAAEAYADEVSSVLNRQRAIDKYAAFSRQAPPLRSDFGVLICGRSVDTYGNTRAIEPLVVDKLYIAPSR